MAIFLFRYDSDYILLHNLRTLSGITVASTGVLPWAHYVQDIQSTLGVQSC
jgi:hypothetical protein